MMRSGRTAVHPLVIHRFAVNLFLFCNRGCKLVGFYHVLIQSVIKIGHSIISKIAMMNVTATNSTYLLPNVFEQW